MNAGRQMSGYDPASMHFLSAYFAKNTNSKYGNHARALQVSFFICTV